MGTPPEVLALDEEEDWAPPEVLALDGDDDWAPAEVLALDLSASEDTLEVHFIYADVSHKPSIDKHEEYQPKPILKVAKHQPRGKCNRCWMSKTPKACTPTGRGSCKECQDAHKPCSNRVLALAHRRACALTAPTNMAAVTSQFERLAVLLDDCAADMEDIWLDVEDLKERPEQDVRDLESLFSIADDVRGRQLAMEVRQQAIEERQQAIETTNAQILTNMNALILAKLNTIISQKRSRSPTPDAPAKKPKGDSSPVEDI